MNSKRMGSSIGRLVRGMPHSNRSGPTGENQRIPKPADQNSPSGSECCLSSKKLASTAKAFPASTKTTPLIPTLGDDGELQLEVEHELLVAADHEGRHRTVGPVAGGDQDGGRDRAQRVAADGVDAAQVIELGHRQPAVGVEVGDVTDGGVGLEHHAQRQREVEAREERVAREVEAAAQPVGRELGRGELEEALGREEPVVTAVPGQGEAHRRGDLGAGPEATEERRGVGVDDAGVGPVPVPPGDASTHSRV